MRGRKPAGPEFVERLQGEADEQQRLKVILQTLSGELSVQEASARLGITPQRFDMLRGQALRGALAALKPGQPGRPRRRPTAAAAEVAALQEEIARLRRELDASKLREEIALAMPGRVQPGEKKSGTESPA